MTKISVNFEQTDIMPKRLIILFLLCHYTVFSVGVGVHVHYCLGFVKDVSVGFVDEIMCCCPANEDMQHCCQDQQLHFKISDDHQHLNYDFNFVGFTSDLETPLFKSFDTSLSPLSKTGQKEMRPPPPKLCESRIRIHSLIFYS